MTFDDDKGHVMAGLIVTAIPLTYLGLAVAFVLWLLAWPFALIGLAAERWYHGSTPWEKPSDPAQPGDPTDDTSAV